MTMQSLKPDWYLCGRRRMWTPGRPRTEISAGVAGEPSRAAGGPGGDVEAKASGRGGWCRRRGGSHQVRVPVGGGDAQHRLHGPGICERARDVCCDCASEDRLRGVWWTSTTACARGITSPSWTISDTGLSSPRSRRPSVPRKWTREQQSLRRARSKRRRRSRRGNLQRAVEHIDNQVAPLHARVAAIDKSTVVQALAQIEFDRARKLVANADVSRDVYDQRRAELVTAGAEFKQR